MSTSGWLAANGLGISRLETRTRKERTRVCICVSSCRWWSAEWRLTSSTSGNWTRLKPVRDRKRPSTLARRIDFYFGESLRKKLSPEFRSLSSSYKNVRRIGDLLKWEKMQFEANHTILIWRQIYGSRLNFGEIRILLHHYRFWPNQLLESAPVCPFWADIRLAKKWILPCMAWR